MQLEGIVQNGVIVPEQGKVSAEGTRVTISVPPTETVLTFGERYAQFKGIITDSPDDLAEQHEHYRLGVARR